MKKKSNSLDLEKESLIELTFKRYGKEHKIIIRKGTYDALYKNRKDIKITQIQTLINIYQ